MPHSVDLQSIFDEGKAQEKITLAEISKTEFEIIEQQRYFEWKEYEITGHIDGMVEFDGRLLPLEIKSTSDYNFKKMTQAENLVETMLAGPHYMQRYPAQLLLYMLMSNKDQGVWVFKNKQNGDIKDRLVELEPWLDYAESIVKKAESVNKHVKDGTEPEGINDWMICRECDFQHICHPSKTDGDHFDLIAELEPLLDRRDELKAEIRGPEKELKLLNDEIKTVLGDRAGIVLAGAWRCKRGKKCWSYERVEL
jgi:CRISPR/Cas system-associated exonuclease Cas4 (RecB family)